MGFWDYFGDLQGLSQGSIPPFPTKNQGVNLELKFKLQYLTRYYIPSFKPYGDPKQSLPSRESAAYDNCRYLVLGAQLPAKGKMILYRYTKVYSVLQRCYVLYTGLEGWLYKRCDKG